MGQIAEQLRSGRFDLLFAQGPEATPAIELAHRLGIVSVWHLPEQVQLPAEFDRQGAGAYLRTLRALAHPYQVVFNNPHSMAWAMNGQPRANFSLIEHAPLEITQRPARDKTILREKWGIPEDRIVLLSVCRPVAGNGWDSLLNTVRRLPRELRAKTAVVLVGKGPADFRYVRRLRRYLARLENSVLAIDPDNLDLYYNAADIFVSHEADDLRPTAVLKALAAGLPILGSECLERSELLHRNVTGFVIPPHGHRALARRLIELLTNPDLRMEMGKHGSDWLASRSHPDVIVENWEKLLLEAAELSDSFGRPVRRSDALSVMEQPAGDRLATAGAT